MTEMNKEEKKRCNAVTKKKKENLRMGFEPECACLGIPDNKH